LSQLLRPLLLSIVRLLLWCAASVLFVCLPLISSLPFISLLLFLLLLFLLLLFLLLLFLLLLFLLLLFLLLLFLLLLFLLLLLLLSLLLLLLLALLLAPSFQLLPQLASSLFPRTRRLSLFERGR
jgi:hypothetical protein